MPKNMKFSGYIYRILSYMPKSVCFTPIYTVFHCIHSLFLGMGDILFLICPNSYKATYITIYKVSISKRNNRRHPASCPDRSKRCHHGTVRQAVAVCFGRQLQCASTCNCSVFRQAIAVCFGRQLQCAFVRLLQYAFGRLLQCSSTGSCSVPRQAVAVCFRQAVAVPPFDNTSKGV